MTRPLAAAIALLLGAACAHPEPFLVLGDLDREHWVVRDCDSGRRYRVIFASSQAERYSQLEREIGASDPAVPVLFEFQATPIEPRMPWSEHDRVSVHGRMSLRRGSCADLGAQESSR